ncbi:AAA family ATPase, partial [Escherichia coli]|uniref:AAA family ATPase n=1 Tax=Escherichia coli TaxID=562 RepID=UPI001CDAC209
SKRTLSVFKIPKTRKNTPEQLVDEAIKKKNSSSSAEGDVFWVVYDQEHLTPSSISCHQKVDTGVSGISVREVEAEIPIKMEEEIPQEIKEIIEEDYKYRYMFSHPTDEGGSVSFPMGRESEGTQKLFEIIPLIRSAFNDSMVVIVDELDNSLHPHIADLIVKLFN